MTEDIEDYKEADETSSTKIKFTSYSRLGTYLSCSEQFKLRYVDRIPFPQAFSEHLALGQLTHLLLEEVLDPHTLTYDVADAACIHLPGWLENIGLEVPDDLEELLEFAFGLADLLYRASDRCRSNTLRNKDGSVPKDVINFPPLPFTEALRTGGLAEAKLEYDNWACSKNSEFNQVSFSWIISRAVFMAHHFKVPSWVQKTIHVELPFSTQESDLVRLPFRNDLYSSSLGSNSIDYFHGKIDWIVETVDREIAVLDHKTSKELPDPQSVLHSPQLNLYAFAYHELYGTWPELIGINHLLSGQVILAALDKEIAISVAKYYRDLQNASVNGSYIRHSPVEYRSPCIRRDWKTKRITEVCPYLSKCWPIYVETLSI